MSSNTAKMGEFLEGRVGFLVTILGVLAVAAVAFGVTTPAERLTKVELAQSSGEQKDKEQDERLALLEGMGDRLEDIAEAVNAKRQRRPRRWGNKP